MWTITLGYEGATDCCLRLNHPNGQSKQYGVESTAWKLLEALANRYPAVLTVQSHISVAQVIWDYLDEDIFPGVVSP